MSHERAHLSRYLRLQLAAAALSLLVSLGCSGSHTRLYIIEILEERAPHLTAGQHLEIAGALVRAEKRTGLDALLLLALMEEESHYKPRAKSRRGALGLLQVRPATGRDVAERHRIRWRGDHSLYETETNVLIGAIYLHELTQRFGSPDMALIAYHQGPTRTSRVSKKGKVPPSRYATRVLRRYEGFRKDGRT